MLGARWSRAPRYTADMPARLPVTKTWKLFINGGFPRSESGRVIAVRDRDGTVAGQVAHASRKDFRDAVVAARKAQPGWAGRTAYNRGQVIYRMAEMLDGKAGEFIGLLRSTAGASAAAAKREVAAAADLCVAWAGWTDKFQHVLGSHNPVAGPYHNFSVPEPTGVVVALAPNEPALVGVLAMSLPPLAAGNTVIATASPAAPLPAALLAEVLVTSDLPAGAFNLLTIERHADLAEHIASHRDVNAVHAGELDDADVAQTLRLGAAENVKRITVRDEFTPRDYLDVERMASPWMLEPFVETKALWHPSAT